MKFYCPDCDNEYLELSDLYIANNPNASARVIEQELHEHQQRDCDAIQEIEYRCEDCGEVYVTVNPGYAAEWPNSSDRWIEQEWEDHKRFCPGDAAEQAFEAEINRLFGTRKLTRDQYKETYSAHRNHETGGNIHHDSQHFACYHYMQSLPGCDANRVQLLKRQRRAAACVAGGCRVKNI